MNSQTSGCFVEIEGVLSPDECLRYIDIAQTLTWSPSGVSTGAPATRSVSRISVDTQLLMERIGSYLPENILGAAVSGVSQDALTIIRYGVGEGFPVHTDAPQHLAGYKKSFFTLLIYLNDNFTGGETRFPASDISVGPRTGCALLIPHGVYHEGLPILSGYKYAFHSFVIYTQNESSFMKKLIDDDSFKTSSLPARHPLLLAAEQSILQPQAERLLRERNFSEAADILCYLAIKEPTLDILCRAASALAEAGREEEALIVGRKAISLYHTDAFAHYTLAKAMIANSRYDEAVIEFRSSAVLRQQMAQSGDADVDMPAHMALHTLEQMEYIWLEGSGKLDIPNLSKRRIADIRASLTELLVKQPDEIPIISVSGRNGHWISNQPVVSYDEPDVANVLNPALETQNLDRHLSTSNPRILVIDNFLSPEGLDEIRKYCLLSTCWRRPYSGGYIGAFPEYGFVSKNIFKLADEICGAFPASLPSYKLAQWWGFVYDPFLQGTNLHADDSDISVNIWITPDDANLDKGSGGLSIWNAKPPSDWTFEKYNSRGDHITDLITTSGASEREIEYRENRAVIFDGQLFHKTGNLKFKQGFTYRRRNITLLFKRK